MAAIFANDVISENKQTTTDNLQITTDNILKSENTNQ